MDILANRLREKREQKHYTQEDVASILNINRVTYTCWEKGKHEPKLEDLVKLANIFETSTDYLLGRYN